MGQTTLNGIFQVAFHVPGELSADLNIYWTVPCDVTLLHVSAVQSDSDQASIIVGDSSDDDEYLTIQSIGASGTPVEFDGSDFVDSDGNSHTCHHPHISDGTVIHITVDFDYKGGEGSGAASDITIVLTFAEG